MKFKNYLKLKQIKAQKLKKKKKASKSQSN